MSGLSKLIISISAAIFLVSVSMAGGYQLVHKTEIQPKIKIIAKRDKRIEEISENYTLLSEKYVALSETIESIVVENGQLKSDMSLLTNIENNDKKFDLQEAMVEKLGKLESELDTTIKRQKDALKILNDSELYLEKFGQWATACTQGVSEEDYKWCSELERTTQRIQENKILLKDYGKTEKFIKERISRIETQLTN